jgi:hypothetical protein
MGRKEPSRRSLGLRHRRLRDFSDSFFTEFYEVHAREIATWYTNPPAWVEKNGHMADRLDTQVGRIILTSTGAPASR